MNKKGAAFLGIIIAVLVFMVGVLFIQHFKDTITTTRVDLDCSNAAGISDGTKLLCLLIDGLIPYYIITLVSIAVGFFAGGSGK